MFDVGFSKFCPFNFRIRSDLLSHRVPEVKKYDINDIKIIMWIVYAQKNHGGKKDNKNYKMIRFIIVIVIYWSFL